MVSPHGVLKQMVPRWLKEPELASMIASTKAAHVRPWRRWRALCLFEKNHEAGAAHSDGADAWGRGFTISPMWRWISRAAAASKPALLTCFIRHTSASLVIQENADSDVLKDMQDFFARIATHGMNYRHTAEGAGRHALAYPRGPDAKPRWVFRSAKGRLALGHLAGTLRVRTPATRRTGAR
jgi:hypothetical protein